METPQNENSKKILDLPNEMLSKIFKFVEAENQTKNLMLVCHRFKNVLESILRFENTFFLAIPKTLKEIKIQLNSQKRFVAMKISVEINAKMFAALKLFWAANGCFIKDVTIFNNSKSSKPEHFLEVLSIVNDAENVEINEKFIVSSSASRAVRQRKIETINFENLKTLTIECENQKIFKPEVLLKINAPQLQKFFYQIKSGDFSPTTYQCLNKFEELETCEMKSAGSMLSIDIAKNSLMMHHCVHGIREIEKFFDGRYDLVKTLKLTGTDFTESETANYHNILKGAANHLTFLETYGPYLDQVCIKFKFPNVKTMNAFCLMSLDNIDKFSRAFPNLEKLNIYNVAVIMLSKPELDLIRAHFKKLKHLKQTNIDTLLTGPSGGDESSCPCCLSD